MPAPRVRNGALSARDVKNEDRSGYVYEKTGERTICHAKNGAICRKMHELHDDLPESVGLLGRKCINRAVIRGDGPRKMGGQ